MNIDPKMHAALLDRLEIQSDQIQKLMDLLLSRMERIPPAERSGPEWGPSGSFAKRFTDLTRQQGDIARKLTLALAAIENSPSKASN